MRRDALTYAVLACSLAWASRAGSATWTTFLNSNDVRQIEAQERIWCATSGAVSVFSPSDTSFSKITNADGLLDNNVLRLACDDSSNWWFLCEAGVSVRSSGADRWTYLTDYHGIPGAKLLSIAVEGDTVWLGTDTGGWFWDTRGDPFIWTGGFRTFSLRGNSILAILPDSQWVWFGTDGGVCRALKQSPGDTSSQLWYTMSQGLPGNEVRCLIYQDTTLWAGTANGAAWLEDTVWVTENQGLPSLDIRSLAVHEATVWAGTGGGVARFEGVEWEVVNNGLPSSDVQCVAVDSAGTVWAGTSWEGIAELAVGDSVWHPYASDGPAGNNFSAIALDLDGSLWCTHFLDPGAARMVSRYYDGEWEIYNEGNEWVTGGIRWVAVDSSGSKWFGIWDTRDSLGGLVQLESDNETYRRYRTPESPVIGAVAVDRDNNLWCSAYPEAVCMLPADDSTWTVYSGIDYTSGVQGIAFDRSGNSWFTSVHEGVGVAALTSEGVWRRVEGLSTVKVGPIAVDARDNVWVGTVGAGLCRIEDFEVAAVYTVENTGGQLLGDVTDDILIDWEGGVWLLVDYEGLSRLSPDGSWESYVPEDGLASDEIYLKVDGLALENESGVLWVATRYGLSRFETGVQLPPPYIDSVEVYPNPFLPSRADHQWVTFERIPAGSVVRVYTPSGRLIKEIAEVDPVTHRAFWDGKNEPGQEVASGMYIFVVTADGKRSVGKIALIR